MPDTALEITCQDLQTKLVDDEPVILIDCREPFEHAIVCLPEARLLPMAEIPSRVGEIAALEGALVVYCHHGMRSAQAAAWLRSNGVPEAQSLAGGIDQWALQIDPSLPRY